MIAMMTMIDWGYDDEHDYDYNNSCIAMAMSRATTATMNDCDSGADYD